MTPHQRYCPGRYSGYYTDISNTNVILQQKINVSEACTNEEQYFFIQVIDAVVVYCVACEALQHIGITLSGVCPCVCVR